MYTCQLDSGQHVSVDLATVGPGELRALSSPAGFLPPLLSSSGNYESDYWALSKTVYVRIAGLRARKRGELFGGHCATRNPEVRRAERSLRLRPATLICGRAGYVEQWCDRVGAALRKHRTEGHNQTTPPIKALPWTALFGIIQVVERIKS